MKIEEGKFYRDSVGKKVGPMTKWNDELWHAKDYEAKGHGSVWCHDGTRFYAPEKPALVAEWTDTPPIWGDMSDAEKGALLLACLEGKIIEFFSNITKKWVSIHPPMWAEKTAYRVKPEPKVETVTEKCHLYRDEYGDIIEVSGHDSDDPDTIANITHTYTITDGCVACKTTIHD